MNNKNLCLRFRNTFLQSEFIKQQQISCLEYKQDDCSYILYIFSKTMVPILLFYTCKAASPRIYYTRVPRFLHHYFQVLPKALLVYELSEVARMFNSSINEFFRKLNKLHTSTKLSVSIPSLKEMDVATHFRS